MISSKFAAFLQNTISEEHLWNAASGHLHYNTKHTVFRFLSLSAVIIHQLHFCTKILPLIPFIATPPFSCIPTLVAIIPTLISRIPIIPSLITRIPRIPTLIPHILCIPTLITRIPIIPLFPFPDFPFRLLQIVGLLN